MRDLFARKFVASTDLRPHSRDVGKSRREWRIFARRIRPCRVARLFRRNNRRLARAYRDCSGLLQGWCSRLPSFSERSELAGKKLQRRPVRVTHRWSPERLLQSAAADRRAWRARASDRRRRKLLAGRTEYFRGCFQALG